MKEIDWLTNGFKGIKKGDWLRIDSDGAYWAGQVLRKRGSEISIEYHWSNKPKQKLPIKWKFDITQVRSREKFYRLSQSDIKQIKLELL